MLSEAEAVRCTKLGIDLWGRTYDSLQRQLQLPYPELPSEVNLADLRMLERYVHKIAAALSNPRSTWLSSLANPSITVAGGTRHMTAWEARREIVRRAIDYLEKG